MAKSKTADKGDSCPAHPRAVFRERLYYTLISKRRAQHNGRDTVVGKNIAELWAGRLGRKRKAEMSATERCESIGASSYR